MQNIFEEYGKTILAVIVAVALLGCILGGSYFIKTMRDEMDVNNNVSYSKSDEALESLLNRPKPTIEVSDTSLLRLHVNETFSPVASVTCTDVDGNALVPTVVSIVFIDSTNGTRTEFIEKYDSDNDVFDIPSVIGKTGTLSVAYKGTDGYNVVAKKTLSFVIDVASS